MSTEKKYTLRSSDGGTFDVDEAVALEFGIVKQMTDANYDSFLVEEVTSQTLATVIKYCKKHVKNPKGDDCLSEDELKKWDANFFNVDNAALLDLVKAADYMGYQSLVDLLSNAIGDRLKGKTPEGIREVLNINNTTPEEEEELRTERQWAF